MIKINYKDLEMLFDNKPNDIMVVDVDAQGALASDLIGGRIKTEFPDAYMFYQELVLSGTIKLGGVYQWLDPRGYLIVFICTTSKRVGKNKDTDTMIEYNTRQCINNLLSSFQSNVSIYSGILNRHTSTWNNIAKHIVKYTTTRKIEWNIYNQ